MWAQIFNIWDSEDEHLMPFDMIWHHLSLLDAVRHYLDTIRHYSDTVKHYWNTIWTLLDTTRQHSDIIRTLQYLRIAKVAPVLEHTLW